MQDKYYLDIPQGDAKSVAILDCCFNEGTQACLLQSGLKKGVQVLEVGG